MASLWDPENHHPFLVCALMAVWMVCSRLFFQEIHPDVKHLFEGGFARVLIVFSAMFIASRHLKASVVMTLAFLVVFRVWLNPDHPGNIVDWFK